MPPPVALQLRNRDIHGTEADYELSVERPILAIFNDTDTDSNGKSSERLSADLCDKYGLSVRFLVVTEKDFMVQDSTSVTLISSWNPSV